MAGWGYVANVSGYQVQCAQNKAFTRKKKTRTTSRSKTLAIFTRMKKGKKYFVRVRAYNYKGGVRQYGAWSKVKKCKIK